MKSVQTNPFVIGAYAGSHYFCDRERETDELIQDLMNGRNVVLIAQRRMGKTGLILHTFHQEKISKHYNVFFIDIFATASIREFIYAFGNAIIDQLKPRGRKFLDQFLQTITSLRPAVKIDALTGEPTLEIGLSVSSVDTTLDEIFAYLNAADKPCIVAFDEFQQINHYAEKNMEALLRTQIQHCPNAVLFLPVANRVYWSICLIVPIALFTRVPLPCTSKAYLWKNISNLSRCISVSMGKL